MEYQNIQIEIEDKIGILVINRPDKLNALNRRTLAEISNAILSLEKNEKVYGIIVTGSGQKSFVAGADISEIAALDKNAGQKFSEAGQAVFNRIEQCSKPVIAAVNGFALGGGCELALACHIRLASTTARFGQPEVGLGLIPGFGGTQRLPRIVGKGRALQLMLTGELIAADDAFRIGLVNQVADPETLIDSAKKILNTIFEKSPRAVADIIKSVNDGLEADLNSGLQTEAEHFGRICDSQDKKEGTTAFLEKRKPHFTGK